MKRTVDGLESPAEAFPKIARWLVIHGYSDQDIHQVLGENVLRMMRVAWAPGEASPGDPAVQEGG